MHVTINKKVVFALLDTLLGRWTATPKAFPYNKRDAVIPQTIIPDDLRANKETLALFYFYVCIYMRGGIESLQAFNALIRMWREHPILFDPYQAQWLKAEEVQGYLKQYIGWDSKAASINWVENSRRLMQHWNGNPLNLLKGLRTYDEAQRRMRNKLTQRDRKAAGHDGRGFRGFQPKMVSMLLYFYDWERFLEKRFLYPAPADFHNFRLGLAHGGIVITPPQEKVRTMEKISKPWRDIVMVYLKARKADPIEVADALWMFSLVMCGNSSLVATYELKKEDNKPMMFSPENLRFDKNLLLFQAPRFREGLRNTCLRCPISKTCTLAIPSKPYYQKGLLILQKRPPIEVRYGAIAPDTAIRHKKLSPPEKRPDFWDPVE